MSGTDYQKPMFDVDKIIAARVQSFTEELSFLIRQAALQQISAAFGTSPVSKHRIVAVTAFKAQKTSKSDARVRRSPEQLEAVSKAIAKFVSSKEGVRVEQISAALQLPTKELSGPIKVLLESKQISKRGDRRATTYFAKR
mgnify:CR=1 FL=1